MRDAILGRRRELDAMGAWLDTAQQGSGRLVLCAGEPGIGKTRLAQEMSGLALASGTTVAWGRCIEAAGSPPLWAWRQVLTSLGVDVEAVLGAAADTPDDRFRVFEAVAATVLNAAEHKTLLIVLDDVHWADEPSLGVLRHFAFQVARASIFVLATFRDVEPASLLPRVLPDLVRAPAVERIDLRGFELPEVQAELSRVGAPQSRADAVTVLQMTGGNPLFVREVARALADGTWRADRPPRSVLELVGHRLDGVSADCRELLQAAAIAGRDFSLPLVAAVIDRPVEGCLALADEAVGYGLVERFGDAGDYRFMHALVREAVEASLTSSERVRLHSAVALAIEATFGGDLSEHLSEIARHWAEVAPYGEQSRAQT